MTVLLAGALTLGFAPVAALAETSEDLRERLNELSEQVNQAEIRQAEAEAAARALAEQARETEERLVDLRGRVAVRARAAYSSGMSRDPLVALLTSETPTRTADGLVMVEVLHGRDSDVLEQTVVAERDLAERRGEADAAREETTAATAELNRAAQEMTVAFEEMVAAEAAERARLEAERIAREEEERRRLEAARRAAVEAQARAEADERNRAEAEAAAARLRSLASRSSQPLPPLSQGALGAAPNSLAGAYCPVGPAHSFIDSWGAPRSGGRSHKGTDVMAPYGAPAYAVTDGVITRTGNGGLGGITLYLRGDSGDVYFYAHNAQNLVSQGQRVTAGQVIARVGNTGNAAGGAPHIHFELHPGGRGAVNPYPFLRALCYG
jgi:peptidoglycan LD-endopeptidase LytH